MKTAIYPGTFNPITNGHMDLIMRASELFDHVIVAVVDQGRKPVLLSLEERLDLIQRSLVPTPFAKKVRVLPFTGLLIDFARQHNSRVLLRGLRAVSDFDYEFQLAGMNRQLASDIETVFLPASAQHAFVSSSIVRDVIGLGGDASQFVPPAVWDALK